MGGGSSGPDIPKSIEKPFDDIAKHVEKVAADIAKETGKAVDKAASASSVQKSMDAIAEGVAKIAGPDASPFVKDQIRAMLMGGLLTDLVTKIIHIIEVLEAKDRIKHMLELLKTALVGIKDNLAKWNTQVTSAMKAGKLQEPIKLPDGVTIARGYVFSAEMNAAVTEFLTAVYPAMRNISNIAKADHPNVQRIENACHEANGVALSAAVPLLASLKQWDATDGAIKNETGINFHVPETEAHITAIKNE